MPEIKYGKLKDITEEECNAKGEIRAYVERAMIEVSGMIAQAHMTGNILLDVRYLNEILFGLGGALCNIPTALALDCIYDLTKFTKECQYLQNSYAPETYYVRLIRQWDELKEKIKEAMKQWHE